jgi:parallel beta-helix repeat protein
LASGGSASGGTTSNYGNDVVADSWAADNKDAGILVSGGFRQTVRNDRVDANTDGVAVRAQASDVTVSDNQLRGNRRFGIMAVAGSATRIDGNTVDGAITGVLVRGAAAVVTSNTIADVTMHAVSLQGDLATTTVERNTVSGHGLTAIDDRRVSDLHQLSLYANDTSGWVQLHRVYPWYHLFQQHPLLVLWLTVVALPLTLGVVLRRRRIVHPYAQTTRWSTQELTVAGHGGAVLTIPAPAGPGGATAAAAGLPAHVVAHPALATIIDLDRRVRVSYAEPS